MAGEHLFARSVFGSRLPSDDDYYRDAIGSHLASPDVPGRLEAIRGFVPGFLQHCLDSIAWDAYDVIGFTSLFEQNLASLALAARIKDAAVQTSCRRRHCEESCITLHRSLQSWTYVCSERDETFPSW